MTFNTVHLTRRLVLTALVGLAVARPGLAQRLFDDRKLEAFVSAAIVVEERIREWAPRIQTAESQEAAEQIRSQANAAYVEAIENTKGISVAEYQTINEAARTDPALLERIRRIHAAMTAQ